MFPKGSNSTAKIWLAEVLRAVGPLKRPSNPPVDWGGMSEKKGAMKKEIPSPKLPEEEEEGETMKVKVVVKAATFLVAPSQS